MKLNILKNIAELIGMVAIVASLIFVGFQLQQDRSIAEAEFLTTDQGLEIEFAQLVQNSPGAWRKGLAGEELNPEEEVEFDLMAYTLFRINANSNRRGLVFDGLTIGLTGDGPRSFAHFIYVNPGLHKWFDRLVEIRGQVDRNYGLSDELRYYPVVIRDLINQLDENSAGFTKQQFYQY